MATNAEISSTTQNTVLKNPAAVPIYAGEELLTFGVSEMPPNTRIYIYCNNINITSFCAPITTGAKLGDPITTSQLGTAQGYLYIPSGDGQYKFLTGEIVLTFSDSNEGVEKSKYFSESILYNHGSQIVNTEEGGTVSLRKNVKIKTSPLGNTLEVNTTQLRLDPCAQTFVVDSNRYPQGVYVSGINLFVYEKDDLYPLAIELRPMDGNKPSTKEYMEGTFVLKNSADIQVYDRALQTAYATVFTFDHLVYLRPGEYAFCVMTKSGKYSLLSTHSGDGKTVKQPFAGRLFNAQNTGEWVGSENDDLTFVIRKAVFTPSTVVFEAQSLPITDFNMEYNRFRLLSTAIDFGDIGSVSYKAQTTTAGTRIKTDYTDLLPGVNADLLGRQVASQAGDVKIQVTMETRSRDVTPMLDRQLLSAQVFRTAIEPYTQQISDSELKASNGTAEARYVGKPVELAAGFDSTGIEVKVQVSRQLGTDIEVFCRVLARNDKSVTNGIYDRNWIRMPLVDPKQKTFSGTADVFSLETYRLLDPVLSYTSPTDSTVTYENFGVYQIKIVFYSNNPVYTPKLKSISAISLI